jgi:uncharacterized protein
MKGKARQAGGRTPDRVARDWGGSWMMAGRNGHMMRDASVVSRRTLLLAGTCLGASLFAPAAFASAPVARARPLPLSSVRLTPSIWATAVETNRRYMMSLDPDRLLHNFRWGAGLQPKGAVYGGWEDQSIAGHILGHYMSALALMYAQTGDRAVQDRLRYIVAELAETQKAHGDGYIGGTTIERDGRTLDGKIAYEELRRHKFSKNKTVLGGFNDSWVPLYTWHKVHAGVIDAIQIGDIAEARPVLVGMSDYLAGVFDQLSDAELQAVLDQEFGGLNDSYAQAHIVTGNPRYLRLAERLRHKVVLDPLVAQQDRLAGLHANTQIPKVLGLATMYEINGDQRHADAARFFYQTVTKNHTYVIGGNSNQEHFGKPGVLSTRLSDRTCEHCNTYNMLKLTRHLYGWMPDASLFDYYERAHLNHVMASQHPKTGMFVYYMPLQSGAKRTFSSPTEHFWCCVGSGMESHAKHGESIYWENGDTLFVNLFIPSRLNWAERGLEMDLATGFPYDDTITLKVVRPPRNGLDVALRLPAWANGPTLEVNGTSSPIQRENGYAFIRRDWKAGDTIRLRLPMNLAVEPMPDDPRTVAFTHGPVVLAATLKGEEAVWHGMVPALVETDPASALRPVEARRQRFEMPLAKPDALTLRPFFDQYDERTAVYFPVQDAGTWHRREQEHAAAEQARAAVDARTIDLLQPTDNGQERSHQLKAKNTEIWSWEGRGMRMAWWTPGSFVEAALKIVPGTNVLRVLYWGGDVNEDFLIEIDGQLLTRETRQVPPVQRFVAVEYPLPPAFTSGKDTVKVRFVSAGSAASIYEIRTVRSDGKA